MVMEIIICIETWNIWLSMCRFPDKINPIRRDLPPIRSTSLIRLSLFIVIEQIILRVRGL